VLDERGHGRSDKPQSGYSIRTMARDVLAVLDALTIDKAVLVGNSIGGMLALQISLDAPERVLGNVILSSGTGLAKHIPAEVMAAFQKDLRGAFLMMVEGMLSAKTKRERPEIFEAIKGKFLAESNFPLRVFGAASQDPDGLFAWDIESRLASIRTPTLIVGGEEDQATPPAVLKVLADNIPGAELRVAKDIGHFYQLEKPQEFTEIVRQFAARVSR
jgi:pimeloyl-ACP methyl ester carboxylesterase